MLFRSSEQFIGQAKGEVFSVTDGLDEADFPGEANESEKHVLEKTNAFLKKLGGGVK